jgi:hypothetical protein
VGGAVLLGYAADILLGVGLLALASIGISYLTPPINHILAEVRTVMTHAAEKVFLSGGHFFLRPIGTLWTKYCTEPVDSLIVELQRIRVSIKEAIERQPKELVSLIAKLHAGLNAIGSATKGVDDQQRLRLGQRSGVRFEQNHIRWGTIVAFLILLIGVASLNSWLLSIFFNEVLGGHILIFKPIEIKSSLLIAVLFAVLEIASGMLLHYTETNDTGTPASKVFRGVPWLILFSLTIIEVVAYALLSQRANIPGHLGMPTEHGLYSFVKYFLAAFGAAITLGLATIGYGLWAELQRISERRRSRAVLKQLDEYAGKIKGVQKALAALEGTAQRASTAAAKAAGSLVGKEASTHQISDIEAEVGRLVTSVAKRLSQDGGTPFKRTDFQTLTWIAGKLGQLVAWGILFAICFHLFEGFLSNRLFAQRDVGSLFPSLLALSLTVGLTVTGFASFRFYADVRHIDVKDQPTSISALFYLAIAVMLAIFGLATVLCVYITVYEEVLGNSALPNIALGIFLPLLLAVASSGLELCLAVAVGIIKVVVCLAGILSCHILLALTWALSGALYLAIQLLRALAVPGDMIRSAIFRKPVTA